MSQLVGKWANPVGGETVEFTAEGAMVVSRAGEILATQRYATRISGAEGGPGGRADGGAGGGTEGGAGGGTEGGHLLLRADGTEAEVVLQYGIDAETLTMGFSGETTVYARVSGQVTGR